MMIMMKMKMVKMSYVAMRVDTIICIIQKLIIDYSDDEDDKVTIVCKAVLQ